MGRASFRVCHGFGLRVLWRWRRVHADTLGAMDAPTRIEVEDGTRVVLTWGSDVRSVIAADVLRAACPCAACGSSPGALRKQKILSRPEAIKIQKADLVGSYAVNFQFAPDSHRTGIFTFKQLKGLAVTAANSDE